MKAKFTLQLTGLVAIVLLVVGTAGYYLSHPNKRGVDERGVEQHHPHFQNRSQQE